MQSYESAGRGVKDLEYVVYNAGTNEVFIVDRAGIFMVDGYTLALKHLGIEVHLIELGYL